ncbi:Prophage integrase IntS [compost metagenome]
MPNLFVRVGARQKTFVLLARFGRSKNSSRRGIGVFGMMSLDEARAKASDWNDLVKRGLDPREEDERRKEEEERKAKEAELARRHTFASVMEDYIAELPYRDRNKHVKQDIDAIRRDILDPLRNSWLEEPMANVRAHHVSKLVKDIRDRGAPSVALTTFRRFKTFFNWLMDPDLQLAYGLDPDNPRNPIRDLMAGVLGLRNVERQRVLHKQEVLAYCRAADAMPYPLGPFYKALLLTGVRKTELRRMRWCEIDWEEKLWIVPAARFKAGTEHLVPLSGPMIKLLRDIRDHLPEFHGDFVFSNTNGQLPASVDGKAMAAFRARVAAAYAEIRPGVEMESFVMHDDRRVVRSNLAALKVPEAVIDTIQGHGKKGMKRIYDQYRYLDETAEALALWAAWLESLTAGTPAPAPWGQR